MKLHGPALAIALALGCATAQAAAPAAQLAIVNPLAAFGKRGMMNLFSTHPSTAERIARLEKLAGEIGERGSVQAAVD